MKTTNEFFEACIEKYGEIPDRFKDVKNIVELLHKREWNKIYIKRDKFADYESAIITYKRALKLMPPPPWHMNDCLPRDYVGFYRENSKIVGLYTGDVRTIQNRYGILSRSRGERCLHIPPYKFEISQKLKIYAGEYVKRDEYTYTDDRGVIKEINLFTLNIDDYEILPIYGEPLVHVPERLFSTYTIDLEKYGPKNRRNAQAV